MSDTSAQRQRRYRAHRRGDHSLCDPDRDCASEPVTVTPPVTRDGVTPVPPGLGSRGRRLWRQTLGDITDPRPGELVLLEEACRTADRLDRLDALLQGDTDAWIRFSVNDDGTEVTVVVDRALSEARQQQIALKQLLAELRQSRGSAASGRQPPAPPQSGTGGEGGATILDLTAHIAAIRGGQAAG